MDLSWLTTNQFFSGGLILMLFGGILVWLRAIPRHLFNFIERFFILKMEILDEDEAYAWMQIWLADKLHKTLSVSVVTKRNKSSEYSDPEDDPIVDSRPKVYFVPACGTYFFWYKRRFVSLSRDRKENTTSSLPLVQSNNNNLRTKESFTVRIFSRNKDLARELIEECRSKALPDDGKIDIRVGTYNYWSLSTRIQPRPIDSVILHGNIVQNILQDINKFQSSQDWYQNIGVPWRRSYLLEGPPGNGKTSLVKAIAGELGMHIYLLMLSDEMSDGRLMTLLSKVGDKALVLLEDVDCAFNKRKKEIDGEKGLTFSGLLNAIDGIASQEGRVIFMTTNHKDKLDPALIRPGRADVHLHIGNASSEQAKKLFFRFFNDEKLAIDFATLIPDQKYSMASLQNYLMLFRDSPLQALRHISQIYESPPKNLEGQSS